MSTEPAGPVGAQPSDPPWARLLFVVLEGREGQCWRAVLLLTPLLLLVTGLVVVTTAAPAGWMGGALGVVGSLTAALALAKQRRSRA